MKFNRYVNQLLEALDHDTTVYVRYVTGDSCNGQMDNIKQMSLKAAAEYFYDNVENKEQSIKYTPEAAADPDYSEPIAPARWYFPNTKEEFILRLEQGKPTCFVSKLNVKIFPLSSSMLQSDMVRDGQNLLFIISKDLNQTRVIGKYLFD